MYFIEFEFLFEFEFLSFNPILLKFNQEMALKLKINIL
jgi:hypothetical protein